MERVYNVPLRKETQKSPKYMRARKATTALRAFLAKHMKADLDQVKIGPWASKALWARGIQHPPHHLKVKCVKDDKGIVQVELLEVPQVKEKPKKQSGKPAEKSEKAAEPKHSEAKTEPKKEAKQPPKKAPADKQ